MADETNTIQQTTEDTAQLETSGDATAQPADSGQYRVETAGPGRKRIIMTISEEAIAEKSKSAFGELQRDATLPGFRKGRAPRRLLEKRFGVSLRNTIKEQLIGDAYGKAIEQEGIQVLGDPDAGGIAQAQLPEHGSMEVAIEVDVTPEFAMPSLKELTVLRPQLELNDQRMDAALQNVREQFGKITPREGPSQKGDIVGLHMTLSHGENGPKQTAHQRAIAGETATVNNEIFPEFAEKLVGVSVGDTIAMDSSPPAPAPAAEGQDAPPTPERAHLECKIATVSQRTLPELTDEFVQPLGFTNVDDLKENLSRELKSRLQQEQFHILEQQVYRYLLANTQMELPENAVRQHMRQLMQRRATEMLERGVPMEQVSAQFEQLGAQAMQQSAVDLKLFFILSKLAEDRDLEITDAMLNGAVGRIAALNGRRPEKMRHDMEKNGQLSQLVLRLRDQMVVQDILEDITVTDMDEASFMAKWQSEDQGIQGAGPNISGIAHLPAQQAAAEDEAHSVTPQSGAEHKDAEGQSAGETHAT